MRVAKKPNNLGRAHDDINTLRDALYRVVERNSKGLSGAKVVRILKSISQEMYGAGIDESLREAEARIIHWDNIASAWDLTWLTLFAYKLKEAHDK